MVGQARLDSIANSQKAPVCRLIRRRNSINLTFYIQTSVCFLWAHWLVDCAGGGNYEIVFRLHRGTRVAFYHKECTQRDSLCLLHYLAASPRGRVGCACRALRRTLLANERIHNEYPTLVGVLAHTADLFVLISRPAAAEISPNRLYHDHPSGPLDHLHRHSSEDSSGRRRSLGRHR